MAAAAASGGDGLRSVRRAEEGGKSVRGREREQRGRKRSEGTRGVVVASLGRPRKQEVAGASSALATEQLRCEGRKTTGEGLAGLAGPARWSWARLWWAARVGTR